MHKLMWLISFIIRQWVLPNPFECFGDKAIIYNSIAGAVMIPLSYAIVGIWYESGSEPFVGSLSFLIVYAAIACILYVLGQVCFAWWAIIGMIVLVICGGVLTKRIVNSDL